MIEMALKSLYLLQNQKTHSTDGVSASLCDTLDLHQFVLQEAKIRQFLAKKIYFWSKPPSSLQNPGCAFGGLHCSDRFFKRLYGPDMKRAKKRYQVYS